jgi:hydrogenase maturation protease
MSREVLLIGVGNEYRSDDGLGVYAVREIKRRNIPGVVAIEQNGEGVALMEAWRGFDRVIVVDALNAGALSGEVCRIDARTGQIPRNLVHYSSHAFGVVEAIELSRLLDCLPETLLLYGIEGRRFDVGPGLTDPVLKNMRQMLAHIEAEVHCLLSPIPESRHDPSRSRAIAL